MSGVIGGGGLGSIAYNYGYLRYKTPVLLLAVVLLVLLVQIVQSLGTWLSGRLDRRLKRPVRRPRAKRSNAKSA